MQKGFTIFYVTTAILTIEQQTVIVLVKIYIKCQNSTLTLNLN